SPSSAAKHQSPAAPGQPDSAPIAARPSAVAVGTGTDVVVVHRGDSLWRIAARNLDPAATTQEVAVAWPQWWAANRDVIGDDPDLIHPGQRLSAPTRRP